LESNGHVQVWTRFALDGFNVPASGSFGTGSGFCETRLQALDVLVLFSKLFPDLTIMLRKVPDFCQGAGEKA
jgi:hypothetical protein